MEAADPDLWQLERSVAGFGGGGSGTGGTDQRLRAGGSVGRFLTVDGLLDRLDLMGLRLDPPSVEAASDLADRAARIFGRVELVGRAVATGWELSMMRPDGRLVALPLPDGPSGRSMACAVLDRCWSGRWGRAEEQAAELLALDLLAGTDLGFSVDAASLCEWFLFDGEVTTEIDSGRLRRLLRTPDSG